MLLVYSLHVQLAMIREKLNTPQAIDAEFATIPVKRLSAGVSTSQYPHNQERNRKSNVFPYEDTRVMIRPNKRNPGCPSSLTAMISVFRWLHKRFKRPNCRWKQNSSLHSLPVTNEEQFGRLLADGMGGWYVL